MDGAGAPRKSDERVHDRPSAGGVFRSRTSTKHTLIMHGVAGANPVLRSRDGMGCSASCSKQAYLVSLMKTAPQKTRIETMHARLLAAHNAQPAYNNAR